MTMPHPHRLISLFLCLLLLVCSTLEFASSAQAQTRVPPTAPHGTCTTDPTFQTVEPSAGSGIISTIVTNIRNILNSVSGSLFNHIAGDNGFRQTLQALATVYIAFYGVMFVGGMVQITMFDFVVRCIKIGFIATLMSGSAWYWFNITVVQFFNDGTDQFINAISSAVLGIAAPANAGPFYVIDAALTLMVSAKTAVTLMAMFFTPPYGPIFGILLVLGLSTFMKAILTAATTYLMALIVKALLFGLAPIFLSFVLFARTRYLFDGWLNQIVNATLQPIMLFTFLGFFITLIGVAISNIFTTPVCWTEWNESFRGSPYSVHYWRFALCDASGACQPYGGKWSATGPQSASGNYPIFPIDILGILVLVILADLCARFNGIVTSIASDLAGASTQLSGMVADMGGWAKDNMAGGGGGGKGKAGAAGGPPLPNAGGKVAKAAQDAATNVGRRIGSNTGGGGGDNTSGDGTSGGQGL